MLKSLLRLLLGDHYFERFRHFWRYMSRGLLKNKIYIKNYYKTKYDKRVLISYITSPLTNKKHHYHTNQQELPVIVKVFDDLGYIVDICDYDVQYHIDYSLYDCIFGFGEPFVNSFHQNSKHPVSIYYGTGRHVCSQNFSSLMRAKEIFKKRGVWLLDSCRVVKKTWSEQTTLVDAIIPLGNDMALKSYRTFYDGPIVLQPATFNAALPANLLVRNKVASKHFFWFAGAGAVHKGLDLLLEVFTTRKDIFLHIGSNLDDEKTFLAAFARELSFPNIHYYGRMDINSELFLNTVKTCAFAILPSCSEGQPTSLLNLMCNGLIPVMTDECCIDYNEYGVRIKECSVAAVSSAIEFCVNMDANEVARRSESCMKDTRNKHSVEMFRQVLFENLSTILHKSS